jgi:hypothetical protein
MEALTCITANFAGYLFVAEALFVGRDAEWTIGKPAIAAPSYSRSRRVRPNAPTLRRKHRVTSEGLSLRCADAASDMRCATVSGSGRQGPRDRTGAC